MSSDPTQQRRAEQAEAAPQAAPKAAPKVAPQEAPREPASAPQVSETGKPQTARTIAEALAGWAPEPVQVYKAAEVTEMGEAVLYDALRASGIPFEKRPDGSLRVVTENGYRLTISDAVSAGVLRVSRMW